MNFQTKVFWDDNQLFTINQLHDSLVKAYNSVVGLDEIHYVYLRNLFGKSIQYILWIYNNTWTTLDVLTCWKWAIIIAMAQSQNNKSDPTNYRPIALTCYICRTLERIINTRVTWGGGEEKKPSLDLGKEYDTTWKYGIIRDLKELGLKYRLPIFISNFLMEHW